ncbi:MAG: endonuclease/exonuclease/phosphatase family protein [Sulfitobacter sp.]
MRVATFNTELARKGPGLLLRDILKGDDPQITAVIDLLVRANADIITLQGFDYDLEGTALAAFATALAGQGLSYPYRFAAPPNAGLMTTLDLDMDGNTGNARDAQGFGRFFGQGAMALLSRYPIAITEVQDFSTLLWRDVPQNLYPMIKGQPFGGPEVYAIQRLSSHGHWVVPIDHPELRRVHVMTFHATPPVFDGPEDRNGRRNHDEVTFWSLYLDGIFGLAPKKRFVLMGDANLDPVRGDGRGAAMTTALSDPRLQDPLPDEPTVLWEQTGAMRVDYVLPSADWKIVDAAILPANPDASRHRLVWIDLAR